MSLLRLGICGILFALILAGAGIAQAQTQGDALLAPARPSLTSQEPLLSSTPLTLGTDAQSQQSPDAGSVATSVRQNLNLNTPDKAAESATIAPEDIPQILLDEMQAVQNECSNNYYYATYHDCRCIAVKFLDARLKSDPDVPRDRILNEVGSQCPDVPSIAGSTYRNCVDYMKDVRSDFVSFCTCSANAMARAYARAPLLNSEYIENLRHEAMDSCGIANNPDYRPNR